MKSIIKKSLQGLLLVPALVLGAAVVVPALQPVAVYAACDDATISGIANGADCAKSADQPSNLFGSGSIFETIVNVLLFVIGAIAVIMLIYGGIRYVLSGGDASAVTAAKNTILYAIVGIVVAILAYAVVHFVVGRFAGIS